MIKGSEVRHLACNVTDPGFITHRVTPMYKVRNSSGALLVYLHTCKKRKNIFRRTKGININLL